MQGIINLIKPTDKVYYEKCRENFNGAAKPVGSLGRLETAVAKIAAVQKAENICAAKKAVIVFCADNGVTAEGVSLYDHNVTAAVVRAMVSGKSCVCAMAEISGADVFPVDIGMLGDVEGVQNCKIMRGTGNIAVEAAMTREQAIKAIKIGCECVREKVAGGYKIIAVGETGMGNTTTAAAVAAVILGVAPREVAGCGAGLDDGGLLRKTAAIQRAIAVNNPDAHDVIDVISKTGGLDIAAMTGAYLGGAAFGATMVADGAISTLAALCAVRICPFVKDYILPSHKSAEPMARLISGELGLEPVIDGGMRLGEGTGAVAVFPLIDMALAVYYNAARFWEL